MRRVGGEARSDTGVTLVGREEDGGALEGGCED